MVLSTTMLYGGATNINKIIQGDDSLAYQVIFDHLEC